MTSQDGTSRLVQMQMRFQERQQREKERRKIEMCLAGSVNSNSVNEKNKNNTTEKTLTEINKSKIIENKKQSSLNSTFVPGKVRQMFDERRQKSTGIDKSYPLKPIIQPKALPNNYSTFIKTSKNSSRNSSASNINKDSNNLNTVDYEKNFFNGNVNKFYNNSTFDKQESIDDETFPTGDGIFPSDNNSSMKLPNVKKYTGLGNKNVNDNINNASGDKNNNANYITSTKPIPTKLKSVVTKKQPPSSIINTKFELKKEPLNEIPIRRRTFDKQSPPNTMNTTFELKKETISNFPVKRRTFVKSKESETTSPTNAKPLKDNASAIIKDNTSPRTGKYNLPSCSICGRRFNEDRLQKHEEICSKSMKKKRKVYDSVKHRIAGTEAEKYVKKNKPGMKTLTAPNKTINSSTINDNNLKRQSNWRKNHDDFIKTIRAAKKIQAHLAKGGKLSDLPPPPPTENLDYIQCPHCNRRFNQSAAERHIPKCATFLHNKPKPGCTTAPKRRY